MRPCKNAELYYILHNKTDKKIRTMIRKLFLLIAVAAMAISATAQNASRPTPGLGTAPPDGMRTQDEFVVNINAMDKETRQKLNSVASAYRSQSRSVLTDIGKSMLYGGVSSVFTILGNEIVSLTKIRSQQKRRWMEMRQKECLFTDSLQSVKGQSDFYRRQSSYGPLDPSDMNFDGITFKANHGGKEVLRMVCHIDTTRFAHMFLHSKFYLVLDTLVFHPYESFLPNMSANRIGNVHGNSMTAGQRDYWNTISQFNFAEQLDPSINVRIDISSSWINEAVEVFKDVSLGSFSVNIPVNEMSLRDSVYSYSRQAAIDARQPTIDMTGDCFVVPRSYMPVAANSPSWGTGEYKMKVVLTERCRYNPKEGRSANWHKDYKQLVRLQNNGKADNEYWNNFVSTFRDNSSTIMKATYTPLLTWGLGATGLSPAQQGGMGAKMQTQQGGGAPQGGGATPPQKQ